PGKEEGGSTASGDADEGVGTTLHAGKPRLQVVAQGLGFLEDHAFLLNGLMDLVEATVPTSLPGSMARKYARELADGMIHRFADAEQGGFFATGPRHEHLFTRLKNASDGAVPSANGTAILALLRLARVSGKDDYQVQAARAVRAFGGAIAAQPSMFATVLRALAEDSRLRRSGAGEHPSRDRQGATRERAEEISPSHTDTDHLKLTILTPDGTSAAAVREGVFNVHPGGSLEILLLLKIAPGFHIAAAQPADREAYATVVRARGDLPLRSLEWEYPPVTRASQVSAALDWEGYAGDVLLRGHGRVAENAVPGDYQLRITVLAQPCDAGTCRAPERVTLTILVVVKA
ncbi:MAG: hypothetical protein WCI73_13830, partial [Phycisphaerae bacterium]